MFLRCGQYTLDLTTPVVMGVLNVTPDSFSDGGRWLDPAAAITRGLELEAEGAAIIDVGGESTRPGAAEISETEELRRVLPVVESLAMRVRVPISVDTSRPAVMRAVCAAGASFINDVRALAVPGALEVVAQSTVGVCLMHMQGQPQTMQVAPSYDDVVAEVSAFLSDRLAVCRAAGIAAERIVIDPGIGFGKRLEHNLALLGYLERLRELGQPVLIGASRKSLIGAMTGRPVDERLAGSLAVATAAALAGASIIRAHDVRETVDALKVVAALKRFAIRSRGENP